MEKEQETEIVEGVVGNKALDLARGTLRRHKKRVKISKICSIMVPILIGILVIGTPLLMHYRNVGSPIYWKNMIVTADISYNELEKEESITIEELNKEKKAKFYWIDNATITGTYLLKQENDIIVIEEHYLIDDIDCVLYVKRVNSTIDGMVFISIKELNRYYNTANFLIKYDFDNLNCYGKFLSDYDYYIAISSTDTTTIESIFSNLTNS